MTNTLDPPAYAGASTGAARTAGTTQGLLLVGTGALLQTMLATLIAPVLPAMQQAFHHGAGGAFLVTFAVTSPALCLALLSPFVGGLIDRVGRRRPLLWGLALYVVAGVAPYFLQTLPQIVASRIVLGVATAIVVTSSITMVGDFFDGKQREHYFELNSALAAIAAITTLAIGGGLGGFGWRVPFLGYGVALLFLLAALKFIWEPRHDAHAHAHAQAGAKFSWTPVILLCLVVLAGAMCFFMPIIFIGVLASAVGVESASTSGLIGGGINIAAMLGAGAFLQLRKKNFSVPSLIVLSFALMGLGLATLAFQKSLPGAVACLVVEQFGAGFYLAGSLIWMMDLLPHDQRGKGTGAYFSSFMLSQPLCGALFQTLFQKTGDALQAAGFFGLGALVAAVILIAVCLPRGLLKKDA